MDARLLCNREKAFRETKQRRKGKKRTYMLTLTELVFEASIGGDIHFLIINPLYVKKQKERSFFTS